MSFSTILLPNKPKGLVGPRWFRKRRLRVFAVELETRVQDFVSTVQRDNAEFRSKSFLTYVAKRLGDQQKQLTKAHRQFLSAFQRTLDAEAWLKHARALQPIAFAMRDTVGFDDDIRHRCRVLEQTFLDFESAMNDYRGESRRELSRQLEFFHQRRRELPLRRHREDVVATLAELEGIIERIRRSLDFFQRTRERAQASVKDAEQIDARLINAAPQSAQRYENALLLLKLAFEKIQSGDLRTAGTICKRADDLLKDVREDLDKLKRYTSTELQEWHAYLSQGHSSLMRFLPEITRLLENIEGQTVTRWKQVRVEMEKPILENADSARLRNRAVAKRSTNSLFPDLSSLQDPELLERFARGVGVKTHGAFRL